MNLSVNQCPRCRCRLEFSTDEFYATRTSAFRIHGPTIKCPQCGELMTVSVPRWTKGQRIAATVAAIIVMSCVVFSLAPDLVIGALQWCGSLVGTILLLILVAAIYFLPAIVGRHKRNFQAILVLNILLGWTFVGWALAMVWACTHEPQIPVAGILPRTRTPKAEEADSSY